MTDETDRPRTLRSVAELVDARLVAPQAADELEHVTRRYALAITPAMRDLIAGESPDGPIARQFLPDPRELVVGPGERIDPIGDERHLAVKGLVHRYPDRVLLKPTHACPVYCRFCFRREMVGPGGEALDSRELGVALDYIRERPTIREVILSGGDPLVLSPRRIGEIVAALDAIGHLEVIRVHTRVPLVDPPRISAAMVAALESRKAVYVVLHANHAREFTTAGRAACARLVRAGVAMLGQTVLLRGINADAAALEALLRAFVANRIKPYYLHHPDMAPGTSHFRVTIEEGQALMRSLRGRVSGLAQPTYVLDIPDGHGKVPIGPAYLDGEGRVSDPAGVCHDLMR
ncbi:MAG: lysine-2,3-aminomutase-like protein [Gammaproteobacteria bacterium]|nr:lysine-2,3-aminomutase-like protein [Gammaproteobacteria bacterium]